MGVNVLVEGQSLGSTISPLTFSFITSIMSRLLILLLVGAVNAQFQCSSGLTTLFNNNQIVTCNPQNPTSCSSIRPGYFCQMAVSGSAFICCGIQAQQCGSNSPQIGTNGQPQTCSMDSNCFSGYSCTSGTCCPLTNTGTVQIGGFCSDTVQCAGGSSCFNQQCACPMGTTNTNGQCVRGSSTVCPNGQVNVNGVCMQQSFLGGQCSFPAQCPTNANCVNGICNCNTGFQPLNGQCSNNGQNGCPSGQVMVNGQCFQQSMAGQQCFFSQQCPTNSQCTNSICLCNNGFQNLNGQCTMGGNNCPLGQVLVSNQCMSYSSPGAFCVSSVQCLEGAQCQSSMCMCQNGKSALNGYCIAPSTGPCSPTQTFYNNQCFTYSLPGGACSAPTQCVGGSSCINQMCQCSNGYTTMYGYCIPSSNNNQGSCSIGQVLINGVCYNQVQNGGFCQFTQQCTQGSCQNNICQSSSGGCGANQVLINGLCYNQVPIGSSCTFAQQCLGGSTCSNNFCNCPSGSQPMNGYCSYNNGTNGNCKSYEVLSNNICYARMPIGSQCSISMQCPTGAACQSQCVCNSGTSFDGNQCSSGITQCQTGLVSVSGQCRALRSLGQTCSVNQECLSFGQCMNSVCTCPTGWLPDYNQICRQQSQNSQCGTNGVLIGNQCYQTVPIGASCQFSQQCLGNSQCNNFICQCPNGGQPTGGQCSGSSYTCSKSGYYPPLQNNQPINCLYNYCPDQYNSVCEYNYQFQNYMCCTKSTSGKKK